MTDYKKVVFMKVFTIFNKVFLFATFIISMVVFNISKTSNTVQSKDNQVRQESDSLIGQYKYLIEMIDRRVSDHIQRLNKELIRAIRQRNASVPGSNVVNLLNERIVAINQELKHLKIIRDALLYDERR